MNKDIIEEIIRINEMMGMKKKVLLETTIFGLTDDLTNSFFNKLKGLWNNKTPVQPNLPNSPMRIGTGEGAIEVMPSDTRIWEAIVGTATRAGVGFNRAALRAANFSDDVINAVFDNIVLLLKSQKTQVDEFYENFFNSIRKYTDSNGKTPFKDLDDTDIIYEIFKEFKKFKKTNPSADEETFLKNIWGSGSEIDARVMADKFKNSFDELDELYVRAARNMTEGWAKSLMTYYRPKYISLLKNYITQSLKRREEVEKLIEIRLDIIAKKIEPGMGKLDQQNIMSDLFKILDMVVLMKNSAKENAAERLKTYLIDKKFLKNNEDFKKFIEYPEVKKIIDDASNSADETFTKGAQNLFSPYYKIIFEPIKKMFISGSPFKKPWWDEMSKIIGENATRVATLIITRSPRLASDLRITFNLFGKKGYLIDKLLSFLIIKLTIVPFLQASRDVWVVNEDIREVTKILNNVNVYCEAQVLQTDFCEEIQKLIQNKLTEQDWSSYFWQYVIDAITPYDTDKDVVGNLARLTYIDETIRLSNDIFSESLFGGGFESAINNLINKTEKDLVKMGFDTSLSNEEAIDKFILENVEDVDQYLAFNNNWSKIEPADFDVTKYDTKFVKGVQIFKKKGLGDRVVATTKNAFDTAKETWRKYTSDAMTKEQMELLEFPLSYFEEMDSKGDFRIASVNDLKDAGDGKINYEGVTIIFSCSVDDCPDNKNTITFVKKNGDWYKKTDNGDVLVTDDSEANDENDKTSEKDKIISMLKKSGNLTTSDNNTYTWIPDDKKTFKKPSYTIVDCGETINWNNCQGEPITYSQNESKIIRKKLIEYKKMKTIKESLKSKLQKKSKKVDVISENLYKVAGKFYNENYNEFFKKFEKLTENYKKSKLFLKEDSSESFNRALNKVFKGDESKLKNEAIPYFLNKLGLEGKIREKVKNELNAKYDDNNVGDLFLDCWADIVVQAFKDNAKSEISEPSNVMDAIEKIMVSKIDSPEFDYQLKKEICKMLKPAQEERQTKVQDLAKKLAQSIIDSSEA